MTSLTNNHRIASIDIFRALTMFFMIFVNDLWTLHDIPEWLGHTLAEEDGMGFADLIFPAFLFIVGLSVPNAIEARRKKGENDKAILIHILQRAFALIVMGFFAVNLENINRELLPVSKYIWQLLMVFAFFLIWNNYEDGKAMGKIPKKYMISAGVVILILLAFLYKGGTTQNPGWMQTHWWGILGLIGWAYLLNALVYLFLGNRFIVIILIWLLFNLLNVMEFASWAGELKGIRLMISASSHSLVMSGILATMIYKRSVNGFSPFLFPALLVLLAAVVLIYGFAVRPYWGISKIRATPSWTTICTGISYGSIAILYLIADVYKKTGWATILSPAGRSTLTCYLVPYYYYALITMASLSLPQSLRGGAIGIVKSLLFALLIVFITGALERRKIRLKI
ncbi:MAG: DUF5009 domain-containing protein [Cyclobacteriaceae bacterium]|nr:DUF5009 domain-containing protein [Cyclobacteriaceae bacterium]